MIMQTRLASKFEIKIAVIGYVSAGKTMVINALLRDKYGEVSMKRATSVVNYFRLTTTPTSSNKAGSNQSLTSDLVKEDESKKERLCGVNDDSTGDEETESTLVRDNNVDGGDFCSAESILKEITTDNADFRDVDQVHVKTYDIALIESLCEMRDDNDTKLILVDVPGINEAGAGGKYRTFVEDHWDTFDCAIVVMDGRQGANTEEQVNLLEFVRDCNDKYKDIQVIILANKIDDPEDEEQEELVKETRLEIKRIFTVTDQKDQEVSTDSEQTEDVSPNNEEDYSLSVVVDAASAAEPVPDALIKRNSLFPMFISTSALYAFIYRTAALMALDQFSRFDKALIDKIGRKELGWKWRTLSNEKKLKQAHKAVSDMTFHQDRIESTNFDKVLMALEKAIGGKEVQTELLRKQIEVSLGKLQKDEKITSHLRSIYEKLLALGLSTDDIPQAFWDSLDRLENHAFDLLDGSPLLVQEIASPLQELFLYHEFATSNGWTEEKQRTQAHILMFMRRFIGLILKNESTATGKNFQRRKEGDTVDWKLLHPLDWLSILQSLLFLSHENHFYESFGVEKVEIERLIVVWTIAKNSTNMPMLRSYNYTSGSFEPNDPGYYKLNVLLDVPHSITDTKHFGHVIWLYCRFMAKLEDDASSR